jgi:glycine oxidase
VNVHSEPWLIVGQGLAGTCLAWQLWWRGVPFQLIDDDRGGASRVAAGLINPVTGKNFEPTPGVEWSLPEAVACYEKVSHILGTTCWHPLPILRLAKSQQEWAKIQSKQNRPDVRPWVAPEVVDPPTGFEGAVRVVGGGRLDTRIFLDASRTFFTAQGLFRPESYCTRHPPARTIFCDGAAGLLSQRAGPHRCAKGEILTLHAPHWPQDQIRIGAGGWLVPIGDSRYKVGSTYTWESLDVLPTPEGAMKIKSIANSLGGPDYEIMDHQAGLRPILRRSQPLIGPLNSGHWIFNGLGSKGSLQAPATARHLADWLESGQPTSPQHDIREYLNSSSP